MTSPAHTPRRVLVVEDNRDGAETFVMLLRALGHEVVYTLDSREALALATSFRPDIAFLDIGMPHIDGYQLAAMLRAEPTLKGICLVAVTGYGSQEFRVRSRQAGFDAHVTKPVTVPLIEATLEHLYGRG